MSVLHDIQRHKAVDDLIRHAQMLRLDMKIENTGVLPAEILLILAWEKVIKMRYFPVPEGARPSVAAAMKRAADAIHPAPPSEDIDRWLNILVRPEKPIAICISPSGELLTDVMANIVNCGPLWTFFMEKNDASTKS